MMRVSRNRWCVPPAATVARGVERSDLSKTFRVGSSVHGFTCTEVRPCPELNLVGYAFTHDQSGCPYYHFDSDDQNNAFNISFRTPAHNNKGLTHVLEHTALCGSSKFPVRDPFFHMLRRSLNTFMNAMTGPDYTMYPFSTTNLKDYTNLLDVYLDATMNPLLRKEDFFQEGHRVEFEKPAAAAEKSTEEKKEDAADKLPKASVNGVVYNEMKGVVSQPSNYFYHELWKNSHPETHYVYNSGGIPIDILDLTHKELVEFHSQHYHPSNAVAMTYGDMDPSAHMEKMNAYFSPRGKAPIVEVPEVPSTARYTEPKTVEIQGPPDLIGEMHRQKRVGVSYVLPQGLDASPDSFAKFSVLSEMLQGGANSPLYKTLIGSQVGTRYCPMSGYNSYMSSPALTFGVEGVDQNKPEADVSAAAIEKRIVETLAESVKTGFEQRRVDSVVFQEELTMRHRSTDFGINLVTGNGAMFCTRGLKPFDLLYQIPALKEVQRNPQVLQDLLKEATEGHGHRVTLSVTPKSDYLDGIKQEIDTHEAKLNSEMTAEKKAAIDEMTASWTAHKDAPQDATVLPTLTVGDISPNSFKEPEHKFYNNTGTTSCGASHAKNRVALIPHGTNGLVYVHGAIPFTSDAMALRQLLTLPEATGAELQDLQDAPLFHRFLAGCGTEELDFEQLEIEHDLCHSGFGFGLNTNITRNSLTDFRCGTEFSFYTTPEKLERALELVHKTIATPVLKPRNDKEKSRFLSVLKSRAASRVAGVQSAGHQYAMTAACSTLSLSGRFSEVVSGMTSVRHAAEQQQKFSQPDAAKVDEELEKLLARYQKYHEGFVQRAATSTFTWATCESKDEERVGNMLQKFQLNLRKSVPGCNVPGSPEAAESEWKVTLNEPQDNSPASIPTGKVLEESVQMETSFAGMAFTTGLTYMDREQMVLRLACQTLKNTFLHREVREEGGAYGVMCQSGLNGDMGGITFGSYRDPTPERSLETFGKCADWLSKADNVTETVLKEAKLSLFSKLDAPTCPSNFGSQWFHMESSYDRIQKSRHDLLSTSVKDIIEIAPKYLNPKAGGVVKLQQAILRPMGGGEKSGNE